MRSKELEARMLQAKMNKSAASTETSGQRVSASQFGATGATNRSPFPGFNGASSIRPARPSFTKEVPPSVPSTEAVPITADAASPSDFPQLKKLPAESELLLSGFTREESDFLHKSVRAAGLQWFEGEGSILVKRDPIELRLRAGQSEMTRWLVLAFPVIDMNEEGAVEAALHFLTESYNMAHSIELQFQPAINIQTEKLEFLMQLPLEGIDHTSLGQMIEQFVVALSDGVKEELKRILYQVSSQGSTN